MLGKAAFEDVGVTTVAEFMCTTALSSPVQMLAPAIHTSLPILSLLHSFHPLFHDIPESWTGWEVGWDDRDVPTMVDH